MSSNKRNSQNNDLIVVICVTLVVVVYLMMMWTISMKRNEETLQQSLPPSQSESIESSEPQATQVSVISAAPTPVVVSTPEPEAQPEPEVVYYTDDDAKMIAQVLYRECGPYGSLPSETEIACVVWCVLNRVDAWGESIESVITAPHQFAYSSSSPVDDEHYALALDVLERWNREQNGEEDVGRVLPPDYMWFSGNSKHNYFRNAYKGGTRWDYSLSTPYDS